MPSAVTNAVETSAPGCANGTSSLENAGDDAARVQVRPSVEVRCGKLTLPGHAVNALANMWNVPPASIVTAPGLRNFSSGKPAIVRSTVAVAPPGNAKNGTPGVALPDADPDAEIPAAPHAASARMAPTARPSRIGWRGMWGPPLTGMAGMRKSRRDDGV